MLFFSEGIIFFISHHAQGFSCLYPSFFPSSQPIPPGVSPSTCGFLPPLPIRFKCHDIHSPFCACLRYFLRQGISSLNPMTRPALRSSTRRPCRPQNPLTMSARACSHNFLTASTEENSFTFFFILAPPFLYLYITTIYTINHYIQIKIYM